MTAASTRARTLSGMSASFDLLVWDWNGTLLADQHVVLDALNALLDQRGMPRATMETYRSLYTRPVRVFYERLFGRPIGDDEWDEVDQHFHDSYHAAVAEAALAHDAHEALAHVADTHAAQSLLSMARHEHLVPLVHGAGIADHFVRIDGLRGPSGARKAGALVEHLAAVPLEVDPSRVVLVGDAIDDADAAAAVGAACVLYDGGSHPREELERAGVPVASSLVEALDLAGFAVS